MRRTVILAWALALACNGASRSKVRQVGGILSIAPAEVNFGDVALGKEATIRVSLQNDGMVELRVDELGVFDDPAFEVTGLPVALGVGEKAFVSVRYRPPALGTHEHSLEMKTDSPAAAQVELAIRGHAVRGLAQLSGDAFDFGDVVVAEKATQTFSLTNNDGHALTEVRIDVPAGGDASAFTVRPPGDQPMQAEQSLIVTVDFTPDRLGDFSATIPVTPCPTCSPRNISVIGRGVTRLLEIEPAQVDFGPVLLGGAVSKALTIRNISKSPLDMKSLVVSGSKQFDLVIDGTTLPATLAPGQVVGATARFRPRELGDASAQASIAASDGAPGLVAMTGTGYGAVARVSPASFFVGTTALGTTRSGTLQITNVGVDPKNTAPLSVSNVSVISNDPSWTLDSATPIEVGEPGSSATLRFSFTPVREGMSQAILSIASNDGLNPEIRIPVAGVGRALQPCTLSVLPASPVNFGPVQVNHASVQGFELTNTTSPADDCVVGDPVLSGGPAFHWPGDAQPAGRTLPPGGRMSVRVEFTPDSARSYRGAVSFYVSNRNDPALTVDLGGVGDASCFYLSPATADFGNTTMGCGIPALNVYAVNHCDHYVKVSSLGIDGPFTTSTVPPFDVAPQSSGAIQVRYVPKSVGDDVGTLYVGTSENPQLLQAGLTGGAQNSGTVLDQWDQSSPKVDLLIVIDNSGSMAEEQHALAANLDHLWDRIALANADYHIAITTTGMDPYTAGWSQCPGGADGGEGGRFFPVDNSRARLLTPETPDAKTALFKNTAVGQCHWKEQFAEPVVAALTDPLVSSAKAPGTPWPADGNQGFLRDDARLALLAVSDADDDIDAVKPPPVSWLVDNLRTIKHGALDMVSFAGIVPLSICSAAEGIGTRFTEIARQLNGKVFDICHLENMGAMLDAAIGDLMQPLSSFPLSARPKDPAAMEVTVNGAVVTAWSYDAASNRLVFPANAVPPPGSHITARYQPACP